MIYLTIICVVLCGVIFYQQWHYNKQIHELVNKLMSKNYAEYEQTKAVYQKPVQNMMVKLDDIPEPFEDDLKALNDMLPRM